MISGERLKFKIYNGYRIKQIPNVTASIFASYPGKNFMDCLEMTKEVMCAAITYYESTKKCERISYARVLLEAAAGASTWVRGVSFLNVEFSSSFQEYLKM